MKSAYLKILFTIAVLFIAGCTSNGSNPIAPSNPDSESMLSGLQITSESSNRKLLGIWTIDFDIESLSVAVVPDRDLNMHLNVTTLIPTPQVKINYYDPITGVMDEDVSITNSSTFNAYDVRGIILTEETYQVLLNPDHWTPLYDIKGGNPVNPFKAYAKSQPNRKFAAHTTYTENYQLYLSDGSVKIRFAVDASYPSNCEEPYLITNFSHGTLKNFTGAETTAQVYVYDWQNNASRVHLYCPAIVGQIPAPFHYLGSNKWELPLVNVKGAGSGEYIGWLIAGSSNSGNLSLFQMVTITISHAIPSNPHIVGSLYFNDSCMDIAVDGGYAYIADGSNGLKILDVSNPSKPDMISCLFESKGYSQRILLGNNFAFITDFDGGLAVIDITNKLKPIVVGRLSLDLFRVYDMAGSGNHIYLALGSHGIAAIDISDPQHPQLSSSTPVREEAMCVSIQGNYMFVAEDYSGITVFDISNPSTPVQVGFADTPGSARDVAIMNEIAFIASYDAGLTIVDISNRRQPQIIKTIFIPDYPYVVEIYRNHAFVGTITGLTILNLSDPQNPQVVGEFDFGGNPQNITFSDDLAFVAADLTGVIILDISTPSSPQLIASAYIHREALELDLYEKKACIAGADGLKIIDISTPREPVVMSEIPLYGNVDINGSEIYVGIVSYSADHQLYACYKVIDISNPSNPVIVYNSPQYLDYLSTSVKTCDGYLYVVYSGYGDSLMEIYNIHKPPVPIFISSLSIPMGGDAGPEIVNDFLYIGSTDGISIVDLSNRENPTIVNTFDCEALMITRCGDRMITGFNKTIRIFDLSNPILPEYLSSMTIEETIMDIKAADSFIYLLAQNYGLRTIRIDNPYNPVLFSSVYIPRENIRIAVQENYAYITKGAMGFCVVQLW